MYSLYFSTGIAAHYSNLVKKMDESSKEQVAKNGQQNIVIHQFYLKDVTFEAPGSPQLLYSQEAWNPEIKLGFDLSSNKLQESIYEMVLSIKLSAIAQGVLAFNLEIQQAGVFDLSAFPQSDYHQLLGIHCPDLLLPHLREIVSSMILQSGFPRLYLTPVDFETFYKQDIAKVKNNSSN